MSFSAFSGRTVCVVATCVIAMTALPPAHASGPRDPAVRWSDVAARAEQDELYRRLKLSAKARCRALSNRAVVPFQPGTGNGRVTATPPAPPSPRQKCVREALRDAQLQGDAMISGSAALDARSAVN